jgi:hypothetical protein
MAVQNLTGTTVVQSVSVVNSMPFPVRLSDSTVTIAFGTGTGNGGGDNGGGGGSVRPTTGYMYPRGTG